MDQKTILILAAVGIGGYVLYNRNNSGSTTTPAAPSLDPDTGPVPAAGSQSASTDSGAPVTAPTSAPVTAPDNATTTASAGGTGVPVLDSYGIPHQEEIPPTFGDTPGQGQAFKQVSDNYGLYFEEVAKVQTWDFNTNYPGMSYNIYVYALMLSANNGQFRNTLARYNAANPGSPVTARK